ncbi:Gfo/Idh/MocA family oxidoreductase [Vineibacter terrae]|uniref:Gfo/Idh/MocA family protein n=1 Tax=Vineibacter terrae TaxID=2586908 RepID=UPI002E352A74|nr:Gfo/Idh/MocA family oxidoreductase [Vineibacter terrae]HEX2885196.1 Gfo/Idh/MocA family oxidoreductase [Vineibacter terrae]
MAGQAALRIALLGCGAFARRYHVPALALADGVRTAVIADPSGAAAVTNVATQLGAVHVPDIDALLAGPAVDAVIVSTPHTLHYAHVGRLLDAGRHVLVDKPFVLHAAEAEELTARARAKDVVGAVAFNRRLDAGCLRAREIIRSGALGTVRYVETTQLGYERAGWFLDPKLGGGGPYTGRASHMTDLIPWLTGGTPLRLRSRLRTGPPGRSDRGGFIDVVFDGFECRMTCIEEGWHMFDEIRVFGDDGMVQLHRPLGMPIGWQLVWSSRRGARTEGLAADPTPGAATRDFLDALLKGGAPACCFADALPSVAMMEAAFVSAAEDERWIAFPDTRAVAAVAAGGGR